MMDEKVNPDCMDKRYSNAHQLMKCLWTKKGPLNTTVYPTWVKETDTFWYIRDLNGGKEFRLVDAKSASNDVAFDHQRLSAVLSKSSEKKVDPKNLPFSSIELNVEQATIRFKAFDKHWEFDESAGSCTEIPLPFGPQEIVSPNGKLLVFVRDYNLWLRNLETRDEEPLTRDGKEDYVYGAPGTAWGPSMGCGLQVLWSPDSQRILTVQRDTREVKSLPVMHHVPKDGDIRPEVSLHKFAYPGDDHIESLRLLSICIESGKHIPANYSQIPVTRNSYGFFTANLGWWNINSQLAYFVDVDRYYKYARVVEFDTTTGMTKVLFDENSDTQINLMNNADMPPSYVPIPETNELLWYSERSGWAHLYLYDLNNGQLKNVVTEGTWLVRDVVTFSPERREIFLQTGSRSLNRNPYYRDLVRVNVDTSEIYTIVSSDHDYFAGAFTDMHGTVSARLRIERERRGTSPTGNYSVVTRSRVNTLPESIVVDREGNEVLLLEKAEIQGLPENWQWPEPVSMLAADGKTDIYGTIFRPSNFSPDNTYPVINDVCNIPDFPFASISAFHNNLFEGLHFFASAALAELGFIVVQIDGRGASYRDKSFKDEGYGNLQLTCMIKDQVAGLKQLAAQRPYMDMSRVGFNEIAGGQGVLPGMLNYPDIFDVGVTNIPHDSRLMSSSMWGDMYEGYERIKQPFPEELADNLKGKLLMMVGMLDTTAPPATVFRVVDMLQKANKDFDLIMLPNLGHDSSGFGYVFRRAWDYFVRHLLAEEPPKEYCLSGIAGMK